MGGISTVIAARRTGRAPARANAAGGRPSAATGLDLAEQLGEQVGEHLLEVGVGEPAVRR